MLISNKEIDYYFYFSRSVPPYMFSIHQLYPVLFCLLEYCFGKFYMHTHLCLVHRLEFHTYWGINLAAQEQNVVIMRDGSDDHSSHTFMTVLAFHAAANNTEHAG